MLKYSYQPPSFVVGGLERGRLFYLSRQVFRIGFVVAFAGHPPVVSPNATSYSCADDVPYNGNEVVYAFTLTETTDVTALLSDTGGRNLDLFLPVSGTELDEAGAGFIRDYRCAFGPHYCRHGCNDCASVCGAGVPVSSIMRYSSLGKIPADDIG